jgi:hypothetical protein
MEAPAGAAAGAVHPAAACASAAGRGTDTGLRRLADTYADRLVGAATGDDGLRADGGSEAAVGADGALSVLLPQPTGSSPLAAASTGADDSAAVTAAVEAWLHMPRAMSYTGGAHCAAISGPRSATVDVVCGPTTSLQAVAEVSTCIYRATLATPAACHAWQAELVEAVARRIAGAGAAA